MILGQPSLKKDQIAMHLLRFNYNYEEACCFIVLNEWVKDKKIIKF